MEPAQKTVDISIELGQEKSLQLLTDIDVSLNLGPEGVNKTKNKANCHEDHGEDVILMFKLYVHQGREKEAVQYFQEAVEGAQNLTPLQELFTARPTTVGKMDILEEEGCVTIKYRFFHEQVENKVDWLQPISEFCNNYSDSVPGVYMKLLLKGYVSHNKKNRTNVKVDYCKFNLTSEQLGLPALSGFFSEIIDDEVVSMNPMFKMLFKTKKAQLNLKAQSFRAISGYYNRNKTENFQHPGKEFKYVNKGIFRQKVGCYIMMGDKVSIAAEAFYESEDVLIRLVKVYSKFLTKLFDM